MQTNIAFSVIRSEVGNLLFEELTHLYPEGRQHDLLSCRLTSDDSRVRALLETLDRHGWMPYNHLLRDQKKIYNLDLSHVYDKNDLKVASYLVPWPKKEFDAGRNDDRIMVLVSDARQGGVDGYTDIARAGYGNGYTISDRLRQRMEEVDLKGIAFRETVLDEPPRKPLAQPYWELTSDIRLPPLSDCIHLYGEGPNGHGLVPFDGDRNKGWFYSEGPDVPEVLYLPPQLRYDADALENFGPFDYALTLERLGGMQQHIPVASARFYRFCREEGLKIDWQPVRVDPADAPAPSEDAQPWYEKILQ